MQSLKPLCLFVAVVAGCSEPEPGRTLTPVAHHGTEPDHDGVPIIDRVPASKHMTLVGTTDFGSTEPLAFGDISVHNQHAYLGGYECGHGIHVANVTQPANPVPLPEFGGHPETNAEDVVALSMHTPHFNGDVLVAGLQARCGDGTGMRGLELWDVTTPAAPALLGFYDVQYGGGVHELSVFKRAGRVYVLALAILSEASAIEQGVTPAPGDVRIIDITDPRHPVQVSDWGARKNAGLQVGDDLFGPPCTDGTPTCRWVNSGGYPATFGHSGSVSNDGKTAYIAYWDAGMIILDIKNLAHPKLIGRGKVPNSQEGDTHSAIAMPRFNETIAITTDEDFSPPFNTEGETDDIWGYVRIWNISYPGLPFQLAKFATPHSKQNRTDGTYAVHNPVAIGPLLFLSWYTDGIRVLDLSLPVLPREIAYHEAPTKLAGPSGPETWTVTGFWGLDVKLPYVYASDFQRGLFIFKVAPSVEAAAVH
ncbi:MAG: LVIVD repeat-containing protein [Kofleriaceae bacterium]